jgi:hypothetical protein
MTALQCLWLLGCTTAAAGLRAGLPLDNFHASGGQRQTDGMADSGDGASSSVADEEQCFPWSLDASIARESFHYPDSNGIKRSASAGPLPPPSTSCTAPMLAVGLPQAAMLHPAVLLPQPPARCLAGELIGLQCDSVICPNPRVRNCYMDDSVCVPDEWCMLEDQV